jgi:hypothetical protein
MTAAAAAAIIIIIISINLIIIRTSIGVSGIKYFCGSLIFVYERSP